MTSVYYVTCCISLSHCPTHRNRWATGLDFVFGFHQTDHILTHTYTKLTFDNITGHQWNNYNGSTEKSSTNTPSICHTKALAVEFYHCFSKVTTLKVAPKLKWKTGGGQAVYPGELWHVVRLQKVLDASVDAKQNGYILQRRDKRRKISIIKAPISCQHNRGWTCWI